MCTICSQVAPQTSDCPYESTSTANAPSTTNATVRTSAELQPYTVGQIVTQLTSTFWTQSGETQHYWKLNAGDSITVNLESLDGASRWFAEYALSAWTAVSGIEFAIVTSGGQIKFTDSAPNAYADTVYGSSGAIRSGTVNVGTDWIKGQHGEINSYALHTYIHEIGHALGLGHAGNYEAGSDGRVTYAESAEYANDSWQMSVMSYFSQTEATSVEASRAYALTPMVADIAAIQALYNTGGTLRTGNTTYGKKSNAGDYYDLLAQGYATMAVTIVDDGGIDSINVTNSKENQMISLVEGTFSSVYGEVGNLGIAIGTVIERAYTGKGNDNVIGNDAGNLIFTGSGDDQIDGGAGDDYLYASRGDDTVWGGDGNDVLRGAAGNDTLYGDTGDDDIRGGDGNDDMDGGDNNDHITGQNGVDKINGGDGDDRLYGGADNDTIHGDAGNDRIRGNRHDDNLYGGDGEDVVFGGNGIDRIYGEGGNDTLFGDTGDDIIDGGDGNDEVSGGIGNDQLIGGAGDDKLYGNRDNDTLHGGAGNDMLWGGNGVDIFVFNAGDARDTIYDFYDGYEQIDLSSWGFNSVNDVITRASASGTGVELNFGNGDVLTLLNFTLNQLDGSDFILN